MGWLQWFQIGLVILNSLAGVFHGSQAAANKASQIK